MKRCKPDEEAKAAPSGMKQPIRLMLHAVDGVVPYMTPILLQEYFPPKEVKDCLVLGMAVRDTCVAPMYPRPHDVGVAHTIKSKKKQNEVDLHKPCGYTFQSTNVDKFLSHYNIVVVPSFDLYEDAASKGSDKITVTSKGVMVWTPHGRHSLDPDSYYEAAGGLESSSNSCFGTVPLFDMAMDDDTAKRRWTASQRNVTWLQHYLQQHDKDKMSGRANAWVPIQLQKRQGSHTVNKSSSAVESVKQLEERLKKHSCISGVAIVGWPHSAGSRSFLNDVVEVMLKRCTQHSLDYVSVLSTRNMYQILNAVRSGANVVGSNLPTELAKLKMALLWPTLGGWTQTKSQNKKLKVQASPIPFDDNCAIGMQHETWARDNRPLLPGCECLACRESKYSRAYIHHLVKAKELLAEILLFSHNLHQLLLFCREATKARDGNQLDEFCDFVESQLHLEHASRVATGGG